jgi:colicin import membrane protein
MGLFDTVKLKANALAADAERAGKVTAAQARTVVLQNEIRKSERELGHAVFSLLENAELAHPDLEAAATRLREARQALADKEAEIAVLRQGAEAGDKVAPASQRADTDVKAPDEAAPGAEVPPAGETAAPAAPKQPGAKPPTAAKKPAAKKKPAVKKASAAKKAPAAKAPGADA